MAPGLRGDRRDLGLPRRPRLGGRAAAHREHRRNRRRRPAAGPGRVPRRGGGLRRGPLRDESPRGARDGPAAAPAAGNLLGGLRTGRCRPHVAAGPARRGVRRGQQPGVRDAPATGPGGRRGVHAHRNHQQRHLRARRVHLRPGGPRRHRRHGLLVVAGRDPPGRARAAAARVLPRPGRRRDRDGHPRDLLRVRQAGRPVLRRPLQGVRRQRRRNRLVGGGRSAAAGAAVGRPAPRAPRARGPARFLRQLRRRVQRADRAQRAVPATGHPAGTGQRRALGQAGGRGRGARDRHGPR